MTTRPVVVKHFGPGTPLSFRGIAAWPDPGIQPVIILPRNLIKVTAYTRPIPQYRLAYNFINIKSKNKNVFSNFY